MDTAAYMLCIYQTSHFSYVYHICDGKIFNNFSFFNGKFNDDFYENEIFIFKKVRSHFFTLKFLLVFHGGKLLLD